MPFQTTESLAVTSSNYNVLTSLNKPHRQTYVKPHPAGLVWTHPTDSVNWIWKKLVSPFMSKIASGELTEAGEVRSVSTEDNSGYHSENNRGKPKIHSVSVGTNTFVKLHRQKKKKTFTDIQFPNKYKTHFWKAWTCWIVFRSVLSGHAFILTIRKMRSWSSECADRQLLYSSKWLLCFVSLR